MSPQNDPSVPRYNVLMLAPTMFFADYGAHVRILEEATSLREQGHQVTILAYPNGRDIAGLKVIRCWGVPFNYRIIVGSSRHRFYLDVMLGLKSLTTMIQIKPDITACPIPCRVSWPMPLPVEMWTMTATWISLWEPSVIVQQSSIWADRVQYPIYCSSTRTVDTRLPVRHPLPARPGPAERFLWISTITGTWICMYKSP